MKQQFDGLAGDYDRYRPRYPAVLVDAVVSRLSTTGPYVVDTGAGTGVALEGLLPRLREDAQVDAVDISADMVAQGRAKFPGVSWHVGEAEPFLEQAAGVDLALAAQAYQWMDRPRYLRAAASCLAPGGVVAILQNNRDFTVSSFLDDYESLLEELSPGYSRLYRSFDIGAELGEYFTIVARERTMWTQSMSVEDFAGMSGSSTQVQRAVAAYGEEFRQRLAELLDKHRSDDTVEISYLSEAFTAASPRP